MKKRKNKNPHNQKQGNFWIKTLIAGGTGLGIILIFPLIIPLFLLKTADPNSSVFIFSVICFIAAGVANGIITAKLCQENQWVSLGTGFLIILLPLIIISFAVNGEFDLISFITEIGITLASSLLSSIIFTKISADKNRKMKKIIKRK